MASYYVNDNAQTNGDHEVHTQSCSYFPSRTTYLGEYMTCTPAVAKAKTIYRQSNGCYWCSRSCHTG